MLTLLQSLSSASSSHLHEEEALPPSTSKVAPQSSGPVPMASPPDVPLEANLNTVRSSQGISIFKKLSSMRIRKSSEGSTLHEPDRVPSKSCQAADHRSPSQSPRRVEESNIVPSTMAAARPKRVSASLIDDRMWHDQHITLASGCDIFQSATASVVPRFYMPGLIRHYSVNHLPRLLTPSIQKKVLLTVDKVLQSRRKQAQCVFSSDGRPRQNSSPSIRHNKWMIHLVPRPGGSA